ESNKNLNESLELLSRTKSSLIVADILLRDFETALISQAKRLGKNVIQGQDMAFGLVVESFWWANQHVLGRISKSEVEKLFQEIIT
ncbi:MAG: hypothetical protein ACE5I1_24410, partial [bacterium]